MLLNLATRLIACDAHRRNAGFATNADTFISVDEKTTKTDITYTRPSVLVRTPGWQPCQSLDSGKKTRSRADRRLGKRVVRSFGGGSNICVLRPHKQSHGLGSPGLRCPSARSTWLPWSQRPPLPLFGCVCVASAKRSRLGGDGVPCGAG